MMRGRFALCALAAFLLPGLAADLSAQTEGTLVVANREGGTVSLFDLASGFEVGRLPIGPVIPHEVAVSPDGRRILSSAYGGNDNHGRLLVVMDLVHVREIGRIDLGPTSRPHSMVFLPDSRRAVVTLEESDQFRVYDLNRPGAPPTLLAADTDNPDGMAWSPLRVAAFDR